MKCAVVIPVYKSSLNDNELISIRRTVSILSHYDIILVGPENLDYTSFHQEYEGFKIELFNNYFFSNISGYNQLMMSSSFYRRFENYDYILICQLDAYVFKDELLDWCQKNYDYIGAPWIVAPPALPKQKKPIIDFAKKMIGTVGNGGFSLRKVKTHLRISKILSLFKKFFPKNEDFFWCYIVPKFFKYKRPTASEALKFAFELAPSLSFEKNDRQLPFGCHAWEKYEPDFWKDYIK